MRAADYIYVLTLKKDKNQCDFFQSLKPLIDFFLIFSIPLNKCNI